MLDDKAEAARDGAAQPAIVAPNVRDLDTLAGQLGEWLAARMPQANGIRIQNLAYPRGAGMSHETILFDALWTESDNAQRKGLVVRIKPTSVNVYQDDMFNEQYGLMALMHESGKVRVAEPLWMEEDAGLLGAPFFVMEQKKGRVAVSFPSYARTGWLADEATLANRRTLWEDSVTQLAMIQQVPVPDFLAAPNGPKGFEQEIDRWRRFIDWVDDSGETRLREAYRQLLSRTPANRPEGIVWGDARLGNMMVGGDFRVVAVMDWEQPSQGGALHDLAWWLLSERNYTVAQGVPTLAGMGTSEETIALWEQVSGKSAADLDWYIGFAIFKQDCLSISTSRVRELPITMAKATPGTRTLDYIDARLR